MDAAPLRPYELVLAFANRCQVIAGIFELAPPAVRSHLVAQLLNAIPEMPDSRGRVCVEAIAADMLSHMRLALSANQPVDEPTRTSSPLGGSTVRLSRLRQPKRTIAHPGVINALHLIGARHGEPALRLEDVSRYVGLSSAYLDKLLQRDTGRTFTKHLREARVAKAVRMLATPAAIKEIAFVCGFLHVATFDRAFFRVHGCSPTQWRDTPHARARTTSRKA